MILAYGSKLDVDCVQHTTKQGVVVPDVWNDECGGNWIVAAAAVRMGMGLYYIIVNTCGKCFSEILTIEQHTMRDLINTQMIRPDWNTLREVR